MPPLPLANILRYATPAGYDVSNVARCGPLLVATMTTPGRVVRLPNRCVKCNAPTRDEQNSPRALYWHPRVFYLVLAAFGPLGYALVALAVRRRATVIAALCDADLRRRRRRLAIGWFFALLGLGCVAGVIHFGMNPAYNRSLAGPLCGLGATAGTVLLLVWARSATRVLAVHQFDGGMVWLVGAGPAFLDSLPVA